MHIKVKELIDKLEKEHIIPKDDFVFLLENFDDEALDYIGEKADRIRKLTYSNKIFLRGLIEFTNICKNDCLYCGIRKSNNNCERYRLSEEDIYSCCKEGYALGFRTFVLQGGEDGHYTDELLCKIVRKIKSDYPDCAVTLSFGERSFESYKALKEAGADRYLLRHETANKEHYGKIHPKEMSYENRMECLKNLKSLGFQVGAGFMVGSPYQTLENLADDLIFLHKFQPHMVGIGPFIPHKDTPFADFPKGDLHLTLMLLSILRLMLPKVLLPATTALGTLSPIGRELGIKAGANVVMPNLSPVSVRKKYTLYNGKICLNEESAQCRECLSRRVASVGFRLVNERGDYGE